MTDFFIDAVVFLIIIIAAALSGLIAAVVLFQILEWGLI
jgi:hypothetical protein